MMFSVCFLQYIDLSDQFTTKYNKEKQQILTAEKCWWHICLYWLIDNWGFSPTRENRWKSHSTLLYCTDLSFIFRTTHVKLLLRAVWLEANTLSGKLKTGLHLSVSFSDDTLTDFLQHTLLRNYGKGRCEHTMSHRWIMTLSHRALIKVRVHVSQLVSMCNYIHDWLMCHALRCRLYRHIPSKPGNSSDVTFPRGVTPLWRRGSITLRVRQVHRVSVLGVNETDMKQKTEKQRFKEDDAKNGGFKNVWGGVEKRVRDGVRGRK